MERSATITTLPQVKDITKQYVIEQLEKILSNKEVAYKDYNDVDGESLFYVQPFSQPAFSFSSMIELFRIDYSDCVGLYFKHFEDSHKESDYMRYGSLQPIVKQYKIEDFLVPAKLNQLADNILVYLQRISK